MPTVAEAMARAVGLHAAGQLRQAADICRQVVAVDPGHFRAWLLLGLASRDLGLAGEAVACLTRATQLQPSSAEAFFQLGTVLSQTNQVDEAMGCFRRALELEPDNLPALANLGVIYAQLEKWAEAADCFGRVAHADRQNAAVEMNLALALERTGKIEGAIGRYLRAIELAPDDAIAHSNLGSLLGRLGRTSEALSHHRRAVELAPTMATALYNLGRALVERWDFEEARQCFVRVLQLEPNHALAQMNLGYVQTRLGQHDEAIAGYRRALALAPRDVDLHFNYATVLLRAGRFAEGWPEFEWRPSALLLRESAVEPCWNGQPLGQGTILIRCEQGFGDALQFIRYAPLVRARAGKVCVSCRAPLAKLLASCEGIDEVVIEGDAPPAHDAYVPLLSLPRIFGTTLQTIPNAVPYLRPEASAVEAWRRELGSHGGLEIGIVWQGNPGQQEDRARSITLVQFAPLAELPGVRLYSLQFGEGREQLRDLAGQFPVTDLGDQLGDFDNTAAIMQNLDLLVTCDSAPAHLAGAIGAKVWVPLASTADWRWLMGRDDSPWYPTMRLFRQTRMGDWAPVFQQIRGALADLASGR